MRFRILLIIILFTSVTGLAQDELSFSDDSTVTYVDSVKSESGISGLTPDKIAFITVVKSAKGDTSAIYIETKAFARRRYTQLFSSISPDYAKALKQYGSDSLFLYVMDGNPITNSVESMLATLDRGTIADIQLISPKQLKKEYKMEDRQAGVLIRTKAK